MSKKDTIFLLSKPNPVGYLLARFIEDEIEVISLLIHKKQRRKGYARLLLKELYAIANKRKTSKIVLEVSEENQAAKKLYEGFKFKKVGVRKKYYKQGNNKVDAVIMALTII